MWVGTEAGGINYWQKYKQLFPENERDLTYRETSKKKIKKAKENFQNANVSGIITIQEGMAMQILRELRLQEKYKEFFDFVLIDADKENVIEYFDMILPLVAIGGVIITDNMLYPEKYQENMKKYSAHIQANPNVRTITSPIGNGEEITVKLR